MSVSPEYPIADDNSYQLAGLPDGLNREGLTHISDRQAEFSERWQRLIAENIAADLHPRAVTRFSESRFAHAVHDLVANHVTVAGEHGKAMGPQLPREAVHFHLNEYYLQFPAAKQLSRHEQAAKLRYQDEMLKITSMWAGEYSEVHVVYALRRAFRGRELLHPTRAMFGLMAAYGQVLKDNP